MNFPEFYQSLLTPAPEISRRINGLQQKMSELQVEAVLIHQQVDLFYLTGSMANGFFIPSVGGRAFVPGEKIPAPDPDGIPSSAD